MGPDTEDLRPPLSLPRPRRVALLLGLLCALLSASGSAAPSAWAEPAAPAGVPAGEAGVSADEVSVGAGEGLGDWKLPTPTGTPDVLRPFSAPPAPWAPGHRGIDLAVPTGQEIRSPADGVVSFSGVVVNREVLSIDHGAGYVSSFEPVESDLEVGNPVSTGDVVARLDTYDDGSHHCTAKSATAQPCLHWGVRLHGDYINPLLMLGDLEPSVLLPLEGGG